MTQKLRYLANKIPRVLVSKMKDLRFAVSQLSDPTGFRTRSLKPAGEHGPTSVMNRYLKM